VALGCMRRTQIGTPYAFTHPRVNALVTGVQTPHRTTARAARARLAFVAHHGSPVAAFDLRKPGKPGLREASCRPGEGTLAFRRSTWDFWPRPGCCRCPAGLCCRLRRACARRTRSIDRRGTARLKPRSKAPRGGSAVPPGSCALRRTGHRYPEERVSRASPARPLTASGDTTASLRFTRTPLEAPLRSEDRRDII
jgi:hypothetical protein